MSASIAELLEDCERQRAFLVKVQAEHPRAQMQGDRVVDPELGSADCDELAIDTYEIGSHLSPALRQYKAIEGGCVYRSQELLVPLIVFFSRMRQEKPELWEAVRAELARQV